MHIKRHCYHFSKSLKLWYGTDAQCMHIYNWLPVFISHAKKPALIRSGKSKMYIDRHFLICENFYYTHKINEEKSREVPKLHGNEREKNCSKQTKSKE